MKCPDCKLTTKVIDRRELNKGATARRRRECPKCKERFTTYEYRDYAKVEEELKQSRKFLSSHGKWAA